MAMTRNTGPSVLVGFAEAFAAVEAIWSLQDAGMHVVAFTRAGAKPAARRIPGVSIVEVPPPEKDLPGAIQAVSASIARMRPDALLPLDDSSLWLSRRVDPGDSVVVGPDADGVDFAVDKAEQVAAAAEVGLHVPETTVFPSVRDVTVSRWPVIIKPAAAVLHDGNALVRPMGRMCAGPAELERAQAVMRKGTVLVQAVVAGTGEGLFALAGEDGTRNWSAHRRIRMLNPHGSASSACESITVDTQLQERVAQMLAQRSWRGLFMAEFLRDASGRAWFMELNGRAWGSLALARSRGFEYPAWAVQEALGLSQDPLPPEAPAGGRARHLGREIGHLAFVLRGPQTRAIEGWPDPWRTLRDLLTIRRGDRIYNWNAGQPSVLATDTWRTLADLTARRGRRRA